MGTPLDRAREWDVVVVGAGPGGTALAARIAQLDPGLGRRTLVLDRAEFPRPKPCGGGLTGHAAEAMATIGLELSVPFQPAPRARVTFGAFERRMTLPRPVCVVRREEFDASLVEQARARGVTVRTREPMLDFRVEDGGVSVKTPSGVLRARVLVGADGAGSLVRKRLRPREAVPIRLFRAEIPAPPGWSGDDGEMLYDFTPLAEGMRGYFWIFPVPGRRLNVGVMHSPSRAHPLGGAELARILQRKLAENGLGIRPGDARGWPAWGYDPRARVSAPHVLTIGDAAGIDALTGEGIAVAMEHAVVAGEAIARAFDRGRFDFADYPTALRRATCGRELSLDRWLAWLLYGGRERWRHFLPLVLYDSEMLELYAARVAGGIVLADRKRLLIAALWRHIAAYPKRRRKLDAAARALERPTALAADTAA